MRTLQLLDGVADTIQIVVQFAPQFGAKLALGHCLVHATFDAVSQFAQTHRAGHARATLERVQTALQVAPQLCVARLLAPCAQGAADLRIKLVRLFQEDRQQLLVDLVVHRPLFLRLRRGFLLRSSSFQFRLGTGRLWRRYRRCLRRRDCLWCRCCFWCQREIQRDLGCENRCGSAFDRGCGQFEFQRRQFEFQHRQFEFQRRNSRGGFGHGDSLACLQLGDQLGLRRRLLMLLAHHGAHFVQAFHHLVDERHLLRTHHIRFVDAFFQPELQCIGQLGDLHKTHGAIDARKGMRGTHEVVGDDVRFGFVQHSQLLAQGTHVPRRFIGGDVEQHRGQADRADLDGAFFLFFFLCSATASTATAGNSGT